MSWLPCSLVLVTLVGCAAESSQSEPERRSNDPAEPDAAVEPSPGGAVDSGPACPEQAEEGAVCVQEVTGKFIGVDGSAPPQEFFVSVCGPICYQGPIESDGSFRVALGESGRGANLLLPLYSTLPHARPHVAGFYFPLPLDAEGPTVDVGELRFLEMQAPGTPIPASAFDSDLGASEPLSVTTGDVTLLIDAGVELKRDFESRTFGDAGEELRVTRVEKAAHGYFVDESLGIEALYALEPYEATFRRAEDGSAALGRIEFANSAELPAGADVEFLALGSYLFPDWVTPAAFEVVAEGEVSADGTVVAPAAGQGFEYLTWVGIRLR